MILHSLIPILRIACVGIVIALTTTGVGQEATQQIDLRPGWNAIFIEVEPENHHPSDVFANLPIESVWTRVEPLTSAQFIQDQNEVSWNDPGWSVYLPEGLPESFLTTLHAIYANHSYLVKLTGEEPRTLTISGKPSARQLRWKPDAFNLRGFPVDPAVSPSFRDWFQSSAAHYNPTSGQLEEMYRMNASGEWRRISGSETLRSGEAYWVFSRGESEFVSPLVVQPEQGEGLDFAQILDELKLELSNPSSNQKTVRITQNVSSDGGILAQWQFDTLQGELGWIDLPEELVLMLDASERHILRIGVRRSAMTGQSFQTVLRISDNMGSRYQVPVSVSRGSTTSSRVQGVVAGSHGGDSPALAGLWVGTVRIHSVSEVHGSDDNEPTPVHTPMQMRLILHMDRNGQVRLLKEVLQMWQDGTYLEDGEGGRTPDQAGRYILLTRSGLASQFKGIALRNGVPVGRRISSVGFDFPGGEQNALALAGRLAIGETLSGVISLAADFPTNPFRHPYHPDHDNLDAQFGSFQAEAYELTRELSFEIAQEDPTGVHSPDYGYEVLGGIFRETVYGFHAKPIHVEGNFRIRRIAETPELNPEPGS